MSSYWRVRTKDGKTMVVTRNHADGTYTFRIVG